MSNSLEHQILEASKHARGDELAILYAKAGELMELKDDINAACFFITHAYIFALEQGLEIAEQLHNKLVKYGRDQ